jgi:hypothetical protein
MGLLLRKWKKEACGRSKYRCRKSEREGLKSKPMPRRRRGHGFVLAGRRGQVSNLFVKDLIKIREFIIRYRRGYVPTHICKMYGG